MKIIEQKFNMLIFHIWNGDNIKSDKSDWNV